MCQMIKYLFQITFNIFMDIYLNIKKKKCAWIGLNPP